MEGYVTRRGKEGKGAKRGLREDERDALEDGGGFNVASWL